MNIDSLLSIAYTNLIMENYFDLDMSCNWNFLTNLMVNITSLSYLAPCHCTNVKSNSHFTFFKAKFFLGSSSNYYDWKEPFCFECFNDMLNKPLDPIAI